MEETPEKPVVHSRILWLDQLRGFAIALMLLFHFCYDLNYYRFLHIAITTDPFWVSFRELIVTLFLFAVGVALVLVHRRGIRWSHVGRRALILGLAAAAVSLATWWIFPRYWVYFGILHLIWIASLLGLAFVGRPLLALSAALGIFLGSTQGWLGTEGFFRLLQPLLHLPERTVDLAPLFPWFAVVLLGIAFASSGWMKRLEPGPALPGSGGRLLALAGRHALAIYLLHQPILFGSVAGVYILTH